MACRDLATISQFHDILVSAFASRLDGLGSLPEHHIDALIAECLKNQTLQIRRQRLRGQQGLSAMEQRDFGIRVGVQNLGCNFDSYGACFPEDKMSEVASQILE